MVAGAVAKSVSSLKSDHHKLTHCTHKEIHCIKFSDTFFWEILMKIMNSWIILSTTKVFILYLRACNKLVQLFSKKFVQKKIVKFCIVLSSQQQNLFYWFALLFCDTIFRVLFSKRYFHFSYFFQSFGCKHSIRSPHNHSVSLSLFLLSLSLSYFLLFIIYKGRRGEEEGEEDRQTPLPPLSPSSKKIS